MRRKIDITLSTLLLIAAASFFAVTFTDQFDVPTFGGDVGPAFAPRGYLLVWMALAATSVLQALREKDEAPLEVNLRQLVSVAAVAGATGYAMTVVGFVFSTVPGVFLFCWAFGYRKPIMLAVLSLAAPLTIWALFTYVFELLLPRSPWFHLI